MGRENPIGELSLERSGNRVKSCFSNKKTRLNLNEMEWKQYPEEKYGGAEGDRTPDLKTASLARSQLRHSPISIWKISLFQPANSSLKNGSWQGPQKRTFLFSVDSPTESITFRARSLH